LGNSPANGPITYHPYKLCDKVSRTLAAKENVQGDQQKEGKVVINQQKEGKRGKDGK